MAKHYSLWQSEQSWDNGAPNAKASIQLLPDCFRWIGEIKAPLNGKALCRFGTGTAGSYATPFVSNRTLSVINLDDGNIKETGIYSRN